MKKVKLAIACLLVFWSFSLTVFCLPSSVFCLPSSVIRITIPAKLHNEKSDFVGKGISAIASEITMIKLEANPNALIGKVSSMKPAPFGFIISDQQSNRVYTFDKNGKFIAAIGQPGKGPHEYVRLGNLVPDPFSDQIFLVDAGNKKILSFRYTGEFVSEFSLPVDPSGALVIHDKDILTLWYQDWTTKIDKERIGIMQVNRKGEILTKKMLGTGTKGGDFNSHTANKLVAIRDGFLYSVFPYTTVYKTDFKLSKEEEYITFDLGDLQVPDKVFLEQHMAPKTDEWIFIQSLTFFRDKIWIRISHKTYGQNYLYDMKSGKLEFISMLGIMKDDLTGSIPFDPDAFTDDFLYEMKDPGTIEYDAQRYGIDLQKHFPGWSLEDNPTIRRARLR